MNTIRSTSQFLLTILVIGSLLFAANSCGTLEDHKVPSPAGFTASFFYGAPPTARTTVENLKSPIGLTIGKGDVIFVTENGTGNNDGSVSAITQAGVKYPVITGFNSYTTQESGFAEGLAHLKYKEGKLYILHGIDAKLFVYDVSGFVPGTTAPVAASTLVGEDIGAISKPESGKTPGESDPYNMTWGPDGNLFIADAAANLILCRNKNTKVFTVYAKVGPFTPPGGSPDAVPTGIVYDGSKFLISTLTGGPFFPGASRILQITPGAVPAVSDYKTGFTSGTDIVLTPGGKPIVTEYGWPFNPSNPSRIANENAGTLSITPNYPISHAIDIELSETEGDTYYLLDYGYGTILKLKGTGI
ncbi:ScyD/ScyE family protein [Larkinella rosea]|uniref:ScyD/ScyE family protein n=1 Tax=Larkinella rosea TaxID=2025312 RepID=A0A3P1B978_9BACT|nr:ScyD/ScyE family protein [Larkinella rosea]RRA97605.1 ScyD/ScyE family protein [Larkinella rosea]